MRSTASRWALGRRPLRRASISTSWRAITIDDDWEFPDTQEAIYEFAGRKKDRSSGRGQSCNGLPTFRRSRGGSRSILGTGGSMVVDQDGYIICDLKNKVVKDVTGKPSRRRAEYQWR